MTDPLPPHSPANEESLLGAVLINPEILSKLNLDPDDFYIERNRMIYQAVQELRATGQQIDVVTVCSQLNKNGNLSACGGSARIAGMIGNCPSSMHAITYADNIRDHALRRKTIDIARMISVSAYDGSQALIDFIPANIDRLARLAMTGEGAEHWRKYVSDLYDDVLTRHDHPQDIYGIPTGLIDFDRITGGLIKGEEIKLSGEPGVGKSMLCMQMVTHAASLGHPGVCYHLEMRGRSVARRVISAMSGVRTTAMKTGKIAEGEWSLLTDAVARADTMPIYMSDRSNWTTAAMRVDLERLVAVNHVEWVLVDYEALLCDDPERDTNARSMIISSRLHGIIKDLNLAGLVVDDMHKAGIASNGGQGQASLAGSARKLYDADSIFILRKKKDAPGLFQLVSEKMREGEGDVSRIIELQRTNGIPEFHSVTRQGSDKTYAWQNQNNGGG